MYIYINGSWLPLVTRANQVYKHNMHQIVAIMASNKETIISEDQMYVCSLDNQQLLNRVWAKTIGIRFLTSQKFREYLSSLNRVKKYIK